MSLRSNYSLETMAAGSWQALFRSKMGSVVVSGIRIFCASVKKISYQVTFRSPFSISLSHRLLFLGVTLLPSPDVTLLPVLRVIPLPMPDVTHTLPIAGLTTLSLPGITPLPVTGVRFSLRFSLAVRKGR